MCSDRAVHGVGRVVEGVNTGGVGGTFAAARAQWYESDGRLVKGVAGDPKRLFESQILIADFES